MMDNHTGDNGEKYHLSAVIM